MKVIKCIPSDKMEWRPKERKMTFGDNIRHITAIERYMYGETILGKPSLYHGYKNDIMGDLEDPETYMRKNHQISLKIFRTLTKTELNKKVKTLGGIEITCWKWLRSMTEHEIHHRGHIYANLTNLSIKCPHYLDYLLKKWNLIS